MKQGFYVFFFYIYLTVFSNPKRHKKLKEMGNNNFLKIGTILGWIAMKQSSLYKIMMFLLFCLSISTNTQAQIYATCTHRDYYKWNDTTKEFEYLNGYDENSMFKINNKLTMF